MANGGTARGAMNADDLPPLRDELQSHGLWANKGLGQHFLLDLNITRRIARARGLSPAAAIQGT